MINLSGLTQRGTRISVWGEAYVPNDRRPSLGCLFSHTIGDGGLATRPRCTADLLQRLDVVLHQFGHDEGRVRVCGHVHCSREYLCADVSEVIRERGVRRQSDLLRALRAYRLCRDLR